MSTLLFYLELSLNNQHSVSVLNETIEVGQTRRTKRTGAMNLWNDKSSESRDNYRCSSSQVGIAPGPISVAV